MKRVTLINYYELMNMAGRLSALLGVRPPLYMSIEVSFYHFIMASRNTNILCFRLLYVDTKQLCNGSCT